MGKGGVPDVCWPLEMHQDRLARHLIIAGVALWRLSALEFFDKNHMNNLLVIGPGHLGARVATLWKQKFPKAEVALKAKTDDPVRRQKWQSLGFTPYEEGSGTLYPNVIFSAPPSGAGAGESYGDEVANAVVCSQRTKDSTFIFTSSGGMYSENAGGIVDETSKVVPDDTSSTNSRSAAILKAERAVLCHPGGIVLRFGGLYTVSRGAHNFWLSGKVSESTSAPNGMINLIHYDDAAVAAMSALTGSRRLRPSCKVILVSDGQPISRLDICKAALKNPLYAGSSIPNFKGDASLIDGKRYDTTMLRKELQWSAKFPNFTAFMENHVCSADEMQVPLLLC